MSEVTTLTETVNKLLVRVNDLEKENEELKETIDRLIAYKVLKKHVLNELLFVVNGIVYDKQASDVLSSGKVLRQHFEVDKIIDYTRKWMEVNRLEEFRCHNCDRHARVVFASICGNVAEEWVQNNTINMNNMSANNFVVTEKMSLREGLLKKQELFEQNQNTQLSKIFSEEKVGSLLFDKSIDLEDHEKLARDEIIVKTSLALVSLFELFDNEIFVIGGSMTKNPYNFIPLIDKYIKKNFDFPNRSFPIIKLSKAREDSGLLGAALLALNSE